MILWIIKCITLRKSPGVIWLKIGDAVRGTQLDRLFLFRVDLVQILQEV